ncbi:DUF4127 family protein [Massilia glaciei]|uniref:DUF4127 domain-containing protein n=1 Tax=Massilia glaciei TaxID=1524097 RepID=A0A2U2HF97_9BURK|nr:DUF4127 family protein [Massilia glaciei]PWF42719.1 DUF4127 domain-containing protein [Massilia glaciei]
MKARRIVALPVDGRPVVREQVRMLVANAGWELAMPPVAALGNLRVPADRHGLAGWLMQQAPCAAGFVISLDMLAYGGLVPSRFIDDPLDRLEQFLALLPALKTQHPEKPVYAFAATMRISNNNVNEEEKTYWSEYGELIWRWSFFSDKHAQQGHADDAGRADEAMGAIPEHVRTDYLATRARNRALTMQALELAAAGMIDRLVLPQDDTAEFGFNIAERRMLEQRIGELGVADKVLVYPGADEVMHTLCAHMVGALSQSAPLSFFVSCGDPARVGQLHALYEDRPVLEAVARQIAAAGARLAATPEDSDLILAVHTRGTGQGDWAMTKPLPDPQPVAPAWLDQLAGWHGAGKPVALLDLAYANGGDPALIGELAARLPLHQLAAYAGWNTASNSIGSLVAQCVLARADLAAAGNQKVLALRLLEDFLYQAVLRQTVRNSVREADCAPEALRGVVAQVFIKHANAWARAHSLGWEVSDVTLPWQRTFEIDIELRAAGRAQ